MPLVKNAHWLICLQQRVVDGTKAVEELLIEARQTVKEAPGTLTGGTEDRLMGQILRRKNGYHSCSMTLIRLLWTVSPPLSL